MKYIALILALFLSACSTKTYERTQTKIITIKSPKIKFSDVWYLRNSDKSLELELFVAGKCIEHIAINHLVCVSDGCKSKSAFNEEYLSGFYPEDTMQNLLLAHPIYDGKNMQKTADGFEQKIQDSKVDISYKVSAHAVLFKDKTNGIIFSIKDLDE